MTRRWWPLVSVLLVRCGAAEHAADADGDADADADADSDADTDADGDADPPFPDCGAREPPVEEPTGGGCLVPDRACPAELPYPGAPCEGDLSCEVPGADPEDTWHADCSQGVWDLYSDWDSAPPLTELCLDPFAGTLEGGAIEIGPAGPAEPFRPFHDCEEVFPIWGGQGSAMLSFRVRVRGVDSPECILVRTTVRSGEIAPPEIGARVAVHCNETLAVYSVLDAFPTCGQERLGMQIDVAVDGIGATSARVLVRTEPECCTNCDG